MKGVFRILDMEIDKVTQQQKHGVRWKWREYAQITFDATTTQKKWYSNGDQYMIKKNVYEWAHFRVTAFSLTVTFNRTFSYNN